MVYCTVILHFLINPDMSIHEFPSETDLINKWMKVVSSKNFEDNNNSTSSTISSKHFLELAFHKNFKIKRLAPDDVTIIFENFNAYNVPMYSTQRKYF